MSEAPRDQNHVPAAMGQSSTSSTTTLPFKIDSSTGRLLTDSASGSGDVSGPGSSTDLALVRWSGTSGTSVLDSAVKLTTTVLSPMASDGVALGSGTLMWADLYLASGAIVNWNNGDVTLTHSANTLAFAGASSGYTFDTTITLGAAAGTTGATLYKGTTSGTVTLSVADAAGTWTMKLPTTDGDAGQFLQTDGSGNTTWAASSAAAGGNNTEVQYNNAGALGGITNATSNGTTLTITSGRATTDFSPSSNDGATLGTTALGFADLHLASGGVINWANGEMTITETNANLLTIAGGALAVSGAISGTSSLTLGAAAGSTGTILLTGTTSGVVTLSVADAAGTYTLKLPTTDGNANEFLQTDGSGNTTWAAGSSIPATTITVANEATDTTCFPVFVTAATGDLGPKSNAGLTFNSNTASLGATLMTATTSLTSATIRASSNDSGSLGASGTAFSDLFLASGAVIDFAAGNAVVTHSSGILTVSTGELRVTTAGTNAASVPTLGSTSTLTNKTVSHTVEPASDDTLTGEVITGLNAGATIAQWEAVYLGSASKWLLTDADAAATAGGVMVGLATASGTDTNPLTVCLRGVIRNDGWAWATIGAPLYLSTTAGAITDTAPSGTDDVIRVIGYVLTDDCIYFNPSNDWITHT